MHFFYITRKLNYYTHNFFCHNYDFLHTYCTSHDIICYFLQCIASYICTKCTCTCVKKYVHTWHDFINSWSVFRLLIRIWLTYFWYNLKKTVVIFSKKLNCKAYIRTRIVKTTTLVFLSLELAPQSTPIPPTVNKAIMATSHLLSVWQVEVLCILAIRVVWDGARTAKQACVVFSYTCSLREVRV